MVEKVFAFLINEKLRINCVLECRRLLWTWRLAVIYACRMVGKQVKMLSIGFDFVQLKLIINLRGFK